MKIVVGLLFLLLSFSSIHAQGPSNFNIEALMGQFESSLNTLFGNINILNSGSAAGDIANCGTSDLSDILEIGAQCLQDNNPSVPEGFFDDLLGATNAKVSLCHVPAPGATGETVLFAFSLTGDSAAGSCPEGEMFAFDFPILLRNVPAQYVVNTAASIVTYSNSDVLATVTDPDGQIGSAVTTSTLPPGVGLNSATGTIFVSSKDNLLDGVYYIDVTTTDDKGGKTTQAVTITLLAAICSIGLGSCGIQCYDPTVYVCISGALCPHDYSRCGTQCYLPSQFNCVDSALAPVPQNCGNYDANAYVCLSGHLCPKEHQLCGIACYRPTIFTCLPGNVLCPSTSNVLCGSTCYNPTINTCCGATLC